MGVMNPRVWGPPASSRWDDYVTSFPGSFSYAALNDADDAVAASMMAPKSGTVTAVGFSVERVIGSPPDYNVGVTELDATGAPTTTPFGGSAGTVWTPTVVQWEWVTLTTPASVTAGDLFAAHIYPTATAPDGNNYVSIHKYLPGIRANPLGTSEYSTAWGGSEYLSIFAIRYDDGDEYGCQALSINGFAFDSADSPDEAGAKITLPMSCECCGASVGLSYAAANASFNVCLYNDAGTLLASWSCDDEDLLKDTTTSIEVRWTPVTLPAGDVYLTVKATHATAIVCVPMLQFASAPLKRVAPIPEADSIIGVSRTDEGEWTEDDTVLPWMGLLLSDITFGSSGGGGARWV